MNTNLSFLNKNLSKASFKEPRLIFQQATPGKNSDSMENIHFAMYNEFCKNLPTIVDMVENDYILGTDWGKPSIIQDEKSTTLRFGPNMSENPSGKPYFRLTLTLHANGLLTTETNGIHSEYNPLPRFSENAEVLFDTVGILSTRIRTSLTYYKMKKNFEESEGAVKKDTDEKLGKLMDEVENGGSGVP